MATKNYGAKPRTKAGKQMSVNHLKATIKLERKKMNDHFRAAAVGDKTYHKSHAKAHKKDLKAREKYLKKVTKLKVK